MMNTPAASDGPRHAAVFGEAISELAVVGSLNCTRCRQTVPFRLRDVGRTITCPHCQFGSVAVGRSLTGKTQIPEELPAPEFGVLLVAARQNPWNRRRFWTGAVLLLAIFVGILAFSPAGRVMVSRIPGIGERIGVSRGAAAPLDDGSSGTELPLAPPDVTLAAIEQLLQEADQHAALVQAQVWLQMLQEFGVNEADPRVKRLVEVIQRLTELLREAPPPPPAFFQEYRVALNDLREGLRDKDLQRAGEALRRATELRDAHPNELRAYSRNFVALESRYRQLLGEANNRQEIPRLLDAAELSLKNDQPLPAAEAIARAMFLGLRTPFDDSEFDRQNRQVTALLRELRFARGKRAVQDAKQLQQVGDRTACDEQLAVAFELLPEHSGTRVGRLLEEAKKLSETSPVSSGDSDMGRRIRVRTNYENALELLGRRGKLLELTKLCEAGHRETDGDPQLEDQRRKFAELYLEALRAEVGDLMWLPDDSAEAAASLALARQALDSGQPWRATASWQEQDSAVQSKGQDVARRAIAQAEALAQANRLDQALQRVAPALVLGDAMTRQQAERLQQQWQMDRARELAKLAEEKMWNDLRDGYREKRWLDVAALLIQFEEEFPQSPLREKLPGIRDRSAASIREAIDALLEQLDASESQADWASLRAGVQTLAGVASTPEDRSRLSAYERTIEQLSERAEQKFQESQRALYRHMSSDEDILQYLQVLREVLAMDVSHELAESKLAVAEAKARKKAEKYLQIAKATKLESLKRKSLDDAIRLDPDGPIGEEARRMLRDLKSPSAALAPAFDPWAKASRDMANVGKGASPNKTTLPEELVEAFFPRV